MSKPEKAKSVHQRLLNVREKTGESFNSLLVRYGLERLLYRLVLSGHADSFVLKGAMLYTLWQGIPRRPTRDIDLLGLGNPTHDRLKQIFKDACHVQMESDGLEFDSESIQTEDIRDDQEYFGIRLRLRAFLGSARVPIQIDVGFGDAVVPPPEKTDYPTILGHPAPRLLAYHPATVIAEKVNAMVVHGSMNSRMKDFYDVFILLNHMRVDDGLLTQAIKATFERRKIELPWELPVAFTADFWDDDIKNVQWNAFLNRSTLSDFKHSFSEVLIELRNRLWPLLQKAAQQ